MATRKHAGCVYAAAKGARQSSVSTRVGLRTEPRALALAVGAALFPLTVAAPAYADVAANTLPTGGQYAYGSGSITQQAGNKLQITQTTDKGTVNWNTFSIGASAAVNFTQPSASSITLNRVLGNNPSEIFGRMTANGQVFLSNPNGVLFAPGASVNVGALFATTLTLSDQDANAGRYTKWTNPGNSSAVINQGTIITANGYTALAGPQVKNDGLIVAHAGSVTLAAGNQVSLDMVGDGLIKVTVDQAALNASAINSGSIQADGGNVLLTARSANALLDTVVNNTGIIRANSLVERNGEIVLDGGTAGVVSNSGTLQAAGTDAGTTGGTVKVLGDKVALLSGSSVDVSGDAGGGTALVGGNFHGAGPEHNASETFVARDARIDADAVTSGNGGNVAVWSDIGTRFYGLLSAKGGILGGDGGFAEVSGKQKLGFDGTVDLGASTGRTGTLLLDPDDLYIGADPANGSLSADASLPAFNANDAINNYFVTAGAINSAGNVAFDLQAAHDAIFNAAVTAQNAGANAFSVTAGNVIAMNAGSSLTTGGGNIVLSAGNGMSLLALNAAGGTISATSSAGDITLGGALSTTNTSAAAVTVNAGSTAAAGTAAGGNIMISGGTITTGAGGTATLFTGSIAGSTGLTALVGSGSGHFRYDSDESLVNFAAAIGAGSYAVYREQPTATITADNKGPITYGGVTPVYTTTFSGVNGDTAVQALSTAATVSDDAVLSSSGNLTAGSHVLAASGAVDQLGYALSYTAGSLTVNQLALTGAAIAAGNSTYGSALVPGAVSFGNVVAGDTVNGAATVDTSTLSGSGNPIVGSYTQTASTALTGADAGNYSFAGFTSAANYTINQLALTGAISSASSTYGSALTPGGATFTNVVGVDVVTPATVAVDTTGLTSTSGNLIAGTHVGIQKVTALGGADGGNYSFAGVVGDYTINQLALTGAAIAASNSAYGSALAPGAVSFGNVVAGDTVNGAATVDTSTLSGSGNPIVGSYTQTASTALTGADAGNYSFAGFTSAANYTIDQLALAGAAIAASNSTYGSALAPGAVSFGNVVAGDTVNGAATVDTSTLSGSGNPIVGSYTQTASTALTGADAGNYSFAGFTSAVNYTINQKAIANVTGIAGVNKTYDGNTVAPLNSAGAAFTGIVPGDNLAVATATGAFADKDVGTAKPVGITGISLGGADSANYSLTTATAATSADITRLGSISWTGAGDGINWSDPVNWAGNAIPDKANVANVNLGGATVTFDSAVPSIGNAVSVDNVSGGALTASGSALTLAVAQNLTLSGYTQASGTTAVTGALSITSSSAVSQTGGTLTVGGTSGINAGANAITLTRATNDFGGAVSLTGGTTQITDANALTLGTLSTGALTVIDTGALNLGTGSVNGALVATSNGGNITESGGITVTGTSNIAAGAGSITLASANDFGGAVTAGGTAGISLNDVNGITPASINAGAGAISLTAGAISAGGPLTASSLTLGSNASVATVTFSPTLAGKNVLLTGSSTSWAFCDVNGCGTSMTPPVFSKTSAGSVDIFFNGVNLGSSAATVSNVVGSIAGMASQIAAQALQEALDTDSVQKQIDYGFAGDVGMTPPMDHRIDDTGISTPECFEQSREGEPCK